MIQTSADPSRLLRNPRTGVEFRIEKTSAETGGASFEMLATYPAGSPAPPPHFHPRQRERFEILEGVMQATIGGERRALRAGETLEVGPGTVHTMWNDGPGTARMRWVTEPALRTEEFFRSVFALASGGRANASGTPSKLDLAVLMRRHRDEIRLARPAPAVQGVLFGALAAVGRVLGRGGR